MIQSTVASQYVLPFAMPFARVSAIFLSLPFYDRTIVTVRMRLILSFLVTLILTGVISTIDVNTMSQAQFVWIVLLEGVTGVCIGFSFRLLVHLLMSIGTITDMMSGLGIAKVLEPVHGLPPTVMRRFYYMLGVTLFVSIDGHLRIIGALQSLFKVYPIGMPILRSGFVSDVGQSLSWGFSKLLVLSLPIVCVSMGVTVAFGALSRRNFEFNIFSLGIPIMLLCSFTICYYSIDTIAVVISLVEDDLLNLLGAK